MFLDTLPGLWCVFDHTLAQTTKTWTPSLYFGLGKNVDRKYYFVLKKFDFEKFYPKKNQEYILKLQKCISLLILNIV